MVDSIYDHIVAIVVVGTIFSGAIVVLPTMSFINLRAVDQQQLRNTALNVFNAMLLDPGAPLEWGSMHDFAMDDPRVGRFGLASTGDSTFYVLDPDKVQRLITGNPLNYCTYEHVHELLGLQGYGFNFRILPPFNVTFTEFEVNGSSFHYQVNVIYAYGGPIPNAELSAIVYYTSKDDFFIDASEGISTDSLGVCDDSISLALAEDELTSLVIVLRVTVADVATLIVTHEAGEHYKISEINVVGDLLILTRTDDTPNDAVFINNATFISNDGELRYLFNSTAKNDQDYKLNLGNYRMWEREFGGLKQHNPNVFVFNYWAVDPETGQGRSKLVIAGPYQNFLGHYAFEHGTPRQSKASVKIQRSIIISGMTYIAELELWDESP